MLSVQIPVVEELLAQSYRQKAEMWAEAAGLSRQRGTEAAMDASAAATTARSHGG